PHAEGYPRSRHLASAVHIDWNSYARVGPQVLIFERSRQPFCRQVVALRRLDCLARDKRRLEANVFKSDEIQPIEKVPHAEKFGVEVLRPLAALLQAMQSPEQILTQRGLEELGEERIGPGRAQTVAGARLQPEPGLHFAGFTRH